MFENVKADIRRLRRYGDHSHLFKLYWHNQGLQAVTCYRLGRWLDTQPPPPGARHLLKVVFHLWWKYIQDTTGIYLSTQADIGPGFYIGHFGGVVVGAGATIGRDCNISQGVTIGWSHYKGEYGVPTLQDRVYVAPGAKVIGPITLGAGTVVGANAVVTRPTDPDAVVAGVPARVIGDTGSAVYIPPDDQA
jgi:serine O-acetyltransferase